MGRSRKLTVVDGTAAPAPGKGEGHYFDQAVFDLHYRQLSLKAQRLALEADLAAAGIEVDADGKVTLRTVKG